MSEHASTNILHHSSRIDLPEQVPCECPGRAAPAPPGRAASTC